MLKESATVKPIHGKTLYCKIKYNIETKTRIIAKILFLLNFSFKKTIPKKILKIGNI